jgi:peptidoglycan/xylan/chitin deacetylase (PgdA/CDA1 family)
MYFGSVRFFKHLIYTIFFLFLGTIIFFAVFFGVKYYRLKSEVTAPEPTALNDKTEFSIPSDISISEIIKAAEKNGYTADSLLDAILIDNPEAAAEFANSFADELAGQNIAGVTDAENEADSSADKPVVELSDLIDPAVAAPAYQKLYPDLYADPPTEFIVKSNVAYLTFDDGPSEYTTDIVNILDSFGIKATFFFSGGDSAEDKRIMKLVADSGHTVAVHSLSHSYTTVYASVESFLEDFNNTYTSVYEATGVKPQIFRFAGGSVNNYNRFIYKEIIAEMTRRGFVYYDWNVSGEDAAETANWTSIYNHVMDGAKLHRDDRAIILLHDSKARTVTVVEDVITAMQDMGYTFEPLENNVMPVTFAYIT